MSVIFTLFCAVGLVGESQMLLWFSTSLGLNPPHGLRDFAADFHTLELGLLGSAAEIMESFRLGRCTLSVLQGSRSLAPEGVGKVSEDGKPCTPAKTTSKTVL